MQHILLFHRISGNPVNEMIKLKHDGLFIRDVRYGYVRVPFIVVNDGNGGMDRSIVYDDMDETGTYKKARGKALDEGDLVLIAEKLKKLLVNNM